MDDSKPQRHVLGTALRRFGAIALLVAVVVSVLATWLVQRVSVPSYTAEGTYNVPLSPPAVPGTQPLPGAPNRPTNPYDAQTYAKSYAALLNQDPALMDHLKGPTGMSVTDLGKAITAVNVPSSAVIKVTFTADRAAAVSAYFDTMNAVFSAPVNPAAPFPTTNIPSGNLRPLQQPDKPVEQPGLAPVAPFVGVVLGVLLGVAAAVLLERLNPQVRSAQDLRAVVTWPVLDLPEQAPGARYESIVLRALEGAPGVRTAAVVSVAGVSREFSSVLAGRLSRAEADLRRSGRLPAAAEPVHWEPYGKLPDPLAERGVQDADAVVMTVPHHARLGATTLALQRLEDLAVQDVVLVLGSRGRATRVARDAGEPETAAGTGAHAAPGQPLPAGATPAGATQARADDAVTRSR